MLIDTHAHLDQEEFIADRPDVISRAVAAGVESIVAVGVTAESSQASVELAAAFRPSTPLSAFSPTIAARPSRAIGSESSSWLPRRRSSPSAKLGWIVIGITAPFDVQQDYFDRHLRLSQERELALHRPHARKRCRRPGDARRSPPPRAAFRRHALLYGLAANGGSTAWNSGSISASPAWSRSRSPTICGPSQRRFLTTGFSIETDSPYLSPHPLRGKRNEPANLVHTAPVLGGGSRSQLRTTCRSNDWQRKTAVSHSVKSHCHATFSLSTCPIRNRVVQSALAVAFGRPIKSASRAGSSLGGGICRLWTSRSQRQIRFHPFAEFLRVRPRSLPVGGRKLTAKGIRAGTDVPDRSLGRLALAAADTPFARRRSSPSFLPMPPEEIAALEATRRRNIGSPSRPITSR